MRGITRSWGLADRSPAGCGRRGSVVWMADGTDRIRLVVLFGGQSAEHEVSRISARHVLAAADPERYDIVPIGITKEGRWQRAEAAERALAAGPLALPDALEV